MRSRWIIGIVVATMLLGGAVGGTVYLLGRSQASLAEHWKARLETADEGEVRDLIQQLSRLGMAGLPPLVEALESSRESVTLAAEETLRSELDRWRDSAEAEGSRKAIRLARLLAQSVPRLPSPVLLWAADFCEDLLEWPIDSRTVDGTQLVADCEAVIRASSRATVRRPPENEFELARAQIRVRRPDSLALSPAEVPPLEPIDEGDEALLGGQRLGPLVRRSPERELERVPERIADDEDGGARPAKPNLLRPVIAPHIPRPGEAARSPSGGPVDASDEGVTDEGNQLIKRSAADVALPKSLLSDFTVMQSLHAERSAEVETARNELQRRGYRLEDLERAAQLTDPDPAIRKRLAETLASRPGLDIRPWLLQLARDEAVEVRVVAVSRLATSAEPAVREKLRELRVAEKDARVRELLDRGVR